MIIEAGGSHGPVVVDDRRKLFLMTAVGAATFAVVSLSYHEYMPGSQRPVRGDALDFRVCSRSYVPLFAPLVLSVWRFVHRLGSYTTRMIAWQSFIRCPGTIRVVVHALEHRSSPREVHTD